MSLQLDDITIRYGGDAPVVSGFSLTVDRGETVVLTGPSGAGKTTIAHTAAQLMPPSSGNVVVDGQKISATGLSAAPRGRRRVQLVFQAPRRAVDPRWSLSKIIDTPIVLSVPRRKRPTARQHALAWAQRCGLDSDLLSRRPSEVSDGQLQRACLARALATQPDYLVCDEATASTDTITTAALVRLICEETRTHGMGVLAVTHDRKLAHFWGDTVHDLDKTATGGLVQTVPASNVRGEDSQCAE